jgi:hypothetical protein
MQIDEALNDPRSPEQLEMPLRVLLPDDHPTRTTLVRVPHD